MNRSDFQTLARKRLRESRVLLRDGCYDGAYYLAGYVVECALKACIARKTKRYDFPDKKTVTDSHTHNLSDLVKLASLSFDLSTRSSADPAFAVNWTVVKDWTEQSRYESHSRPEAADLIAAVTSRKHGVLQWVKQYW